MLTRMLLLSTLSLLPPLGAHAVDTTTLSPPTLLELGTRLEALSGPHQWQQLWQQARSAGLFEPDGKQLRFTLSAAQLPELARRTLAQADQADALLTTWARYRRDFAPLQTGSHHGQAYHALCLEVDWRALPSTQIDTPQAYLGLAGLRRLYPCD